MQTFNPTPLQNFGASGTPNPSPTPEPTEMQWTPHHSNMGINHKGRDRVFILIVVVASFILFIILLLLTGRSRTLSKLQANAYESTPTAIKTDDGSISISTPQNGTTITPPFMVQGQAKGFWFNQGLFPVTIYDTEKNVVMKTYAIAQGDWSDQEKLVPFKVTVDAFDTQPTKKAGHIAFKKANATAGLPNSEYLVVVEFGKKPKETKETGSGKNSTTSTTTGTSSKTPACRDDKDNDGDGLVDVRDPGCHTDGNAANISSYEINKTSEVNLVGSTPNYQTTSSDSGTVNYSTSGYDSSGNQVDTDLSNPPSGTSSSGSGSSGGVSCHPYGCATNNPKNYNGSNYVPDGTPLNAFGFPQI